MAELPLVRVDVPAHRAWLGNRLLDLSRLNQRLLVHFAVHAGRALSSTSIYDEVWANGPMGDSKTVQMHVSTLRRALGDGKDGVFRYVTTVHGSGYRFEAEMLDPASILRAGRPICSDAVVAALDALSARLDRVERAVLGEPS